ncbi:MAG TPA: trypsin-like peptidase domain-containing protein [Ktedonobacteraceae bacterium]|nr:trypsin-like peptidase domain-containing protein [Ktedonobacteraceae bacterium]
MTQQDTFSSPQSSSASTLADVFSPALERLVERVQPGIVQVRRGDRGAGTGIVWRNDGYIITNFHVITGNSVVIQVLLNDGRTFDAEVVEGNPRLDLALLKIPVNDLTAILAGDSAKLRVGELVFAIGHPWGQRYVVTAGVFGRMSEVKLRDSDGTIHYIQSDVLIAPGNSGGPLLNADGEVVGINAMIFGGDLAVSIPSNVVSTWLANLPSRQVMLALGAYRVELPATFRQQAGQSAGLLIVSIKPDEEGILVGDILLAADGKALDDVATLLDVLARKDAVAQVEMRVIRGGEIQMISVQGSVLEN